VRRETRRDRTSRTRPAVGPFAPAGIAIAPLCVIGDETADGPLSSGTLPARRADLRARLRARPRAARPPRCGGVDTSAEIRRAIAEGEAKPGDRLPPAKDFAAVLKVNVNTVRRAFRELRDEGSSTCMGEPPQVPDPHPMHTAQRRTEALRRTRKSNPSLLPSRVVVFRAVVRAWWDPGAPKVFVSGGRDACSGETLRESARRTKRRVWHLVLPACCASQHR
jgi:hypothetical protein